MIKITSEIKFSDDIEMDKYGRIYVGKIFRRYAKLIPGTKIRIMAGVGKNGPFIAFANIEYQESIKEDSDSSEL